MYEELHNLCIYCKNSDEHDNHHVVKFAKNEKKFTNLKKRDIDI